MGQDVIVYWYDIRNSDQRKGGEDLADYRVITATRPWQRQLPTEVVEVDVMPTLTEMQKRIGERDYRRWFHIDEDGFLSFWIDRPFAEIAEGLALELLDPFNREPKATLDKLTSLIENARGWVNMVSWDFVAKKTPPWIKGERFSEICERLQGYTGMIFEGMCGWHSYFESDTNRTVVAVDMSENALLRYSHPKRLRLCGDLNETQSVKEISHCPAGSFDHVLICFGCRYLVDPARTFSLLRQLLKPASGKLVLVENPLRGIRQLVLGSSDPALVDRSVRVAGFGHVQIEPLFGDEEYYLLEASV